MTSVLDPIQIKEQETLRNVDVSGRPNLKKNTRHVFRDEQSRSRGKSLGTVTYVKKHESEEELVVEPAILERSLVPSFNLL